MLLVNDGSTDNSGIICDDYAKNDKRVRVIHKENAGVSAARNTGLENAVGEWVGFVDADDYVLNDYLLCNYFDNHDANMIQYGYIKETSTNEVQNVPHQTGIISDRDFFQNGVFKTTCWSYFYRRSMIVENNITFPIGIKYSEDREFIIKMAIISEKILQVPKLLYFYCNNDGSAVNSLRSFEHCLNDVMVLNNIMHFIKGRRKNVDKSIILFVYKMQINSFLQEVIRNRIEKKDLNISIKNIIDVRDLPYFLQSRYRNLTRYLPFFIQKTKWRLRLTKLKNRLN